jgi:serine/threonine-protein kinase
MKREGEGMLAPVATVAIEPACTEEPHQAGQIVLAQADSIGAGLRTADREEMARVIGRYVLFREVAHGGMATVHLGRLRGVGGFTRTVAIKRLLPPFARNPEFVAMFLDEGRLAARIKHPNVVPVMDIVASDGELFLVMEYVHGEGFSKLLKRARTLGIPVPPGIAVAVLIDVLYGLHAAHETRDERGEPLGIVHRDVSPQNMIVGVDGIARVLDFGIAKAAQCAHTETRAGELKGKLTYMAPEQVTAGVVDRRTDVYAAGVTLWEALTGQRMFPPLEFPQLLTEILKKEHVPPSCLAPTSSPELDAVVLCALERDPRHRYATAGDMAADLERIMRLPSRREIGEWVTLVAEGPLRRRAASIAEIENTALIEVAPRRSRPWVAGSVALGIAALLGIAGGQWARWWPFQEAPAYARAAVLAAGSAASFSVDAPAAIPSASAVAVAPSAQASASAAAAERPGPRATPWWMTSPMTPSVPTAKPPLRPPPDDCTPPYLLDADGVRIPKRWCT